MIAPLAHAGHYLVSLLYLLPVVVLGAGVAWQRHKDNADQRAGEAGREDGSDAEPSEPL